MIKRFLPRKKRQMQQSKTFNHHCPKTEKVLAVPKFSRELGRVSNFNQSINWDHRTKDHVEIGHLTKYDAFRANRDQVMDLEVWFKIHTNVSNYRSLIRCSDKHNKKPHVGKQNYLTWRFVCFDIHLQKWPFIIRVATKFKFKNK